MRYVNHIDVLRNEFQDKNYKLQIELLSQGDRIRVPTSSRHSFDGYINVIDSYNSSTSRAHMCMNQTIVDILKKQDIETYQRLKKLHDVSIVPGSKNKWVPIHKEYYDLKLVRKVIQAIKTDYLRSKSRKKSNSARHIKANPNNIFKPKKKNHSHLLQQTSKLGRNTSEKSIKRNLDKGYTADWWPFVEDEVRFNAGMKCECCGVNFVNPNNQYVCNVSQLSLKNCFPLYHVHHKNRNTLDNSSANLEALCLTCHSFNQGSGHAKFRTGSVYQKGMFQIYESSMLHHRILNQMRRQQGIDIVYDFDFNTLQRVKKPVSNINQKIQQVINQQTGIIEKQEGLIERLISFIKRTVS